MYEEKIVLCGANSYERKFYINPDFEALPENVKNELKIMCVLFTEDVGGILTLVFEENGEYLIFDEKNKNITEKCFEEFIETKEQNNLNNEDLLISSLITLAPKKLCLHFESENYNKKIVNTIEQIFGNKVVVSSMPLLELVR